MFLLSGVLSRVRGTTGSGTERGTTLSIGRHRVVGWGEGVGGGRYKKLGGERRTGKDRRSCRITDTRGQVPYEYTLFF